MTKNLIAVLVLVASAFAADVRVPGAAVYGRLFTNQAFSSINNAYIMDLVSSGGGVCFSFFNSDGVSHNLDVTAFVISETSPMAYTGNTARWNQVPVTPAPTGVGGSTTYTFPAVSTTQLYVRTPGGFRLAMVFASGTGAGVGSVIYAQTGSACGSNFQWNVGEAPATGTITFAAAGIVSAVTGVRHVASCISISISTTVASAATPTFNIRDGGVAGNCTSGNSVWNMTLGVPATIGSSSQFALCGLNIAGTVGNSLQVCAVGVAVAGVNYRTAMTGYDTQ